MGTQLQDALHLLTQALLYPVIVVLLLFVCYALFSLGSLAVEYVRERRYFNVVLPRFLRDIEEIPVADMPHAIGASGLLRSQRDVLTTIFENRDLDEEGLWALAKRLLLQEKELRGKVVSRNDSIAKLAPMVGLMGTLIPLGPGIVAFGRGDGTVMASAMLVAFDTTVTGLVVAAVMFIVARVRRRWYASYSASLEAGATTLLERIGNMAPAERMREGEPSTSTPRAGDSMKGALQQAGFVPGAAQASPREAPDTPEGGSHE